MRDRSDTRRSDTRTAATAIHRQILSAKPAFPRWINSSETKADAKASVVDSASDLKVVGSRLRIDVGRRARALPITEVDRKMDLGMEASR